MTKSGRPCKFSLGANHRLLKDVSQVLKMSLQDIQKVTEADVKVDASTIDKRLGVLFTWEVCKKKTLAVKNIYMCKT